MSVREESPGDKFPVDSFPADEFAVIRILIVDDRVTVDNVPIQHNGTLPLAQVALEDPDIGFILPREGALLSCDCLSNPASSKRPGNAHQLIDFLLSAEGGAGVAGTIWFPTPNHAAREILPADYSRNPVLFPANRPAGTSEFVGDNPALDAQFSAAMQRLQVPQ